MPKLVTKDRLDKLVLERGLAESRQEAQGLIMAGHVLVDGERISKCGAQVRSDAKIEVTGGRRRFASRGGLKLEGALDRFGVDPSGRGAIDIGASTGGFTDCLLMRGAARAFCVDVGYGQLAEKLRVDPRVAVKDRFNARFITPADLPWPCDMAVIDVSFISLKHILPPLFACLQPGSPVVALVKPQFEVGKGNVGKGGLVRDQALRLAALDDVIKMAVECGYEFKDRMESPVTGADGNVEYLIYLTRK
jgi:23S rRNA (cytidine1920-2'-O)/16S rRNA (cytidine1409-2'-O)-methyltransferase